MEIEYKLYVPNLSEVQRTLESSGAELTKPRVHEYNIRYEDAANSLRAQGIVLRLRRDSRVRLTVKAPLPDEPDQDEARSRFEAEVEVDDFETMHLMLETLGYRRSMVYEKYRTTYELDGVEIVLDEMPYGNFVEIEGERAAIQQVRSRLGLEGATSFQHNYSQLFEHVRRNLNLAITDLTFASFAGVEVPPHAFAVPAED